METENTGVGFALLGIKTEQFAVFEENYVPKKEIALGASLQFRVDNEKKQIGVFLGFEFLQAKKVFIKIQVSCHFKIEDNAWNSFAKESKLIVPKEFLAHLVMISTGTIRGVLFAKTEGTPFSKYVIPTINVAVMISKDASFDLVVE